MVVAEGGTKTVVGGISVICVGPMISTVVVGCGNIALGRDEGDPDGVVCSVNTMGPSATYPSRSRSLSSGGAA